MAKGTAVVVITGNLGFDPEIRYAQSGTAVASMRIPCERGYGERKVTDWFTVKAFGKTAEFVAEHLTKGSLVNVVGVLGIDSWEKDGEKKYAPVILADKVNAIIFGKKKDDAGPDTSEDDIPF